MIEDKIELHTVGIFRGKEYEMQEVFNGLLGENQRLNNIIKEAREYIKDIQNTMWHDDKEVLKTILEILDKVDKEKE